jgi:carbamoyl-phosphate synthase large subunit
MPKEPSINSILLIGSGPIVIGQACEFDYSGSQAARSLRENGFEVVLVNSNPATIMTDPLTADQVYLRPLTVDSVRTILEEQPQIDAVLPTMGGQTALNVFKEATEQGLWEAHGVRAIGVDLKAVDQTENREAFRQLMEQIGVKVPRSQIANSFLEGKEIAQEMGLPLVLRPSYTLGGSGGAVVREKEAYEQALQHALEMSPVHEVLIDQGVLGWKEFELELLRDKHDNVCIICAIENMDPMGVHTGDSITVAPAMTLSDYAYQRMRDMAITMMRSLGNFSGGCNVQFAMNPADEEIVAIEINPRVSRSSALASKATGYPIAKIAGLLATGFTLDELVNPVTQNTSAFFEPSLDYVIVKIPRWNFRKLLGYKQELGFSMKAVGEVMGIGRSFNEALQKACQSLETDREGLSGDGKGEEDIDKLVHSLEHPSEDRFFHIKDGLERGLPLKSVQKLTRMDSWFLNQIQELVNQEKELRSYQSLEAVPAQVLEAAKREGFSDAQIAYQLNTGAAIQGGGHLRSGVPFRNTLLLLYLRNLR